MVKSKKWNSLLKDIAIFLLFIGITFIVFFNRFQYITEAYGLGNVDTDGTLWYYWAQTFLEKQSLPFDQINLIGFPFGYDVSYIPFSNLIYSGIISILHLIGNSISNIVVLSNITSLMVYPLQAFGTYLLVYYVTKNRFAGFLAGVISGFSYFFVLMNRGALSLNHIYWIPLTLLFMYRAVRERRLVDSILAGISFAILFAVNAYWGFFTAIFIGCILFIEISQDKGSLYHKVRFLLIYGIITAVSTLIINWNFFLQYFQTSQEFNEARVINANAELLSPLEYINPSFNSLLYSFGTGTDFFLGFIALGIGISGIVVLRKQSYYKSYLFALGYFLIAVILSTRIPGFGFINNIYFDYFGIFRAVSRLNIFVTLFLAIMVGFVVKYSTEYLKSKHIKPHILIIGISVLTIGILMEGMNKDSSWRELTFISPIETTYKAIRENDDINVIAQYPMAISNGDDGFPANYQLIGQIIHQKKLVSGADPFNQEAMEYYDTIKDIEVPETIDILRENGVDTIIINKKFFANGDDIIRDLKNDPRLVYQGKYQGDFQKYRDRGNTISYYNEVSAYIEVFRIKE